jgi:hypothetical protein
MQAELELPADLGKAPAGSRVLRWKMGFAGQQGDLQIAQA